MDVANQNNDPTTEGYAALTVTSPACFAGDEKDQDRARWSEPSLTACVCDGVTSSPFAAEAADIVARFSPALFQGNVPNRLRSICDLLVVRRLEAQRAGIATPAGIPKAMQSMLQEVTHEKTTRSFQTTLVAANLTLTEGLVNVAVARCGDSAFLAFAPHGELLAWSPSIEPGISPTRRLPARNSQDKVAPCRITLGPGDEILAKVLGKAGDYPEWSKASGIDPEHTDSWLACAALDHRPGEYRFSPTEGSCGRVLELDDGDILLVPKYLVGARPALQCQSYVLFPYSRLIRVVGSEGQTTKVPVFSRRGTATAVLPDHVYTGEWTYFRERFPLDTHFVLCSDGFYGAFRDPAGLWAWLKTNEAHLRDQREQHTVLRQLHARLHDRFGDDDIAFVWVRPRASVLSQDAVVAESQHEGVDHAC